MKNYFTFRFHCWLHQWHWNNRRDHRLTFERAEVRDSSHWSLFQRFRTASTWSSKSAISQSNRFSVSQVICIVFNRNSNKTLLQVARIVLLGLEPRWQSSLLNRAFRQKNIWHSFDQSFRRRWCKKKIPKQQIQIGGSCRCWLQNHKCSTGPSRCLHLVKRFDLSLGRLRTSLNNSSTEGRRARLH